MTIALLALCVGDSIDVVALFITLLEFAEVKKVMQNNNDFWFRGACGAKGHGNHQLL